MQGVIGEEEAVSSAWLMSLLLDHSPHLSVCLVSLLLLAIVSYYYYYYYGKGYEYSKLAPGSLGLPLIGETLQFAFDNTCPIGSPPPFLSSRLRKYGTVFKTHLIGRPTLVSMDPELNKFFLSNEEKLVQVTFPNSVKNIVGSLLTLHGAPHRRYRELAMSILSPSAIQDVHLNPLQECSRSSLRAWLHMPIIDAQHECRKFTFTYMVKRFLSLAPEDTNMQILMKDYLLLMTGYDAVPLDIPGTTYNKVLKARKRIITTLWRLVQARRKIADAEPKDYLDKFLKEKDECGKDFSEKEIVERVFILLLGGFETSSVLLTCIIKFISENAHVVDELRKEHTFIRSNKKANEMLDWDDFKEMHFTELVIREALRMASIAHLVTREAIQDIAFKDMVIPKGWMILINFSMVHLNPSHFKNPLNFDPWRWKDTKNNNQALLMPFGGGIRSCLGALFAKFQASIFIHYLVTSYKWDRIMLADGHLDQVSSLSFPIIRNGLLIKVEPL